MVKMYSRGVLQAATLVILLPAFLCAEYLVKEGDNATLSCNKTGELIWDKEVSGTVIAIRGALEGDPDKYGLEIQDGTQMVTIKNATLDDGGVYRCYQLFTTDYDKYEIQVQVPPEDFYVETAEESVNENTFATIRCNSIASKPAPEVTWTRHNADGSTSVIQNAIETVKNNADGTLSKTSEINIYADRRVYGARFYCTGEIKTAAMEYHNVVNTNVTVKLTPGQTFLWGVNTTSVEGEVVQLVCSANDAIPAAQVTWTWNSDPVEGSVTSQRNGNGTYDVTSLLEFKADADFDGDTFVCTITNDVVLEELGSPLKLQGTLTVHFAPKFDLLDTGDRIVFEGSSFELSCPVRANPFPDSSTWIHNAVYVSNSSRHCMYGPLNDTTLSVHNITSSDQGLYACEARNEVGTRRSDDIKVVVQYAPVCRPQQKYKFACGMNNSAELSCFVEAYPRDNVIFGWNISGSWEITSGILDPSQTDGAYSVLNYAVGSEDDYRRIQCQASNGVLEMKKTCLLHVLPPGPANRPNDCKVQNVTSSHASIACWEDFDGGSTTWYSLQAKHDDNFLQLLNQTSLNFEWNNLTHNTTYTIRICARNEEFWQSESCTSSFTVSTPLVNESSPVTEGPPEDNSNARAAYIALAVICSLLVFAVLVAVTVMVITRQGKQNDIILIPPPNTPSIDERPTPAGRDDVALEATAQLDEVLLHEEVEGEGGHTNHVFVDGMEGDPIYDRADSMTSAIALQDITLT